MSYWISARFKGTEVLVRCTEGGELLVDDGFVPMVYKPGGKVYRTRPERLAVAADARPVAQGSLGLGASASSSAGRSNRSGSAKGARGRGPGGSGKGVAKVRGGSWGSVRSEDEAIQLWTDGACTGNPGPAGLGVFYRHKGDERELSEYLGRGTNNIAELTAILRGVEMVEDPATPVDILTDSSYCVGLLTKGWKAKANAALVDRLRQAVGRLEDVRILKVPGHSGVEGNERADQLATGAIANR